MKVIKQGTPRSESIWIGTCCDCESVIEATQSELTHIRDDQRDGSFSWEKCIVCDAGGESGYGGVIFYPKS